MRFSRPPVQAAVRRTAVGLLCAAAASSLALATAVPTQAREPRPITSPSANEVLPSYAVPVESLGGRTLAQYLVSHEERVLQLIGS
jgi:hypothetical protein